MYKPLLSASLVISACLGCVVSTHASYPAGAAPATSRSLAEDRAPGGTRTRRTIQEIWFTGNMKLTNAKLARASGINVGDVYNGKAIGEALTRIVNAYRAAGSDVALRVDISLPDATHTVVRFAIDENGSGGIEGAAPRPGGRMGIGPPPSPATRQ